MAYKRSSRRRVTKRSLKRAPRKTVANIARSIVRKEIKKSVEVKRIDTVINEYATFETYAGYLFAQDMTSLIQGTTSATRIGNQVKFIGFRAHGFLNSNVPATPVWVRILLLATQDPSDVTFSSELFTNSTGGTLTPTALTASMTLMTTDINKVKYNVLYSKTLKLNTANNGVAMLNIFKKVQMPIKYEDNTYGAANQSRRVHFVMLCAEAPNDTSASGIVVESSIRFQSYYIDP